MIAVLVRMYGPVRCRMFFDVELFEGVLKRSGCSNSSSLGVWVKVQWRMLACTYVIVLKETSLSTCPLSLGNSAARIVGMVLRPTPALGCGHPEEVCHGLGQCQGVEHICHRGWQLGMAENAAVWMLIPTTTLPLVSTLSRGETHVFVHCTFINLMKAPNEKTLIFNEVPSNHFMF